MIRFGDERLPKRFWKKSFEDESGCWVWAGFIAENGYGKCKLGQTSHYAHRLVYRVLVGEIGTLDIDHLCRTRECINPAHLEPVSRRENVLRGVGLSAINAKKTHCPRGHALDGKNLLLNNTGRTCRTCHYARNNERRRRQRANAHA